MTDKRFHLFKKSKFSEQVSFFNDITWSLINVKILLSWIWEKMKQMAEIHGSYSWGFYNEFLFLKMIGTTERQTSGFPVVSFDLAKYIFTVAEECLFSHLLVICHSLSSVFFLYFKQHKTCFSFLLDTPRFISHEPFRRKIPCSIF